VFPATISIGLEVKLLANVPCVCRQVGEHFEMYVGLQDFTFSFNWFSKGIWC
jgi:hypothetical protein